MPMPLLCLFIILPILLLTSSSCLAVNWAFLSDQSQCQVGCLNGGVCAFQREDPAQQKCICLIGIWEGDRCERNVAGPDDATMESKGGDGKMKDEFEEEEWPPDEEESLEESAEEGELKIKSDDKKEKREQNGRWMKEAEGEGEEEELMDEMRKVPENPAKYADDWSEEMGKMPEEEADEEKNGPLPTRVLGKKPDNEREGRMRVSEGKKSSDEKKMLDGDGKSRLGKSTSPNVPRQYLETNTIELGEHFEAPRRGESSAVTIARGPKDGNEEEVFEEPLRKEAGSKKVSKTTTIGRRRKLKMDEWSGRGEGRGGRGEEKSGGRREEGEGRGEERRGQREEGGGSWMCRMGMDSDDSGDRSGCLFLLIWERGGRGDNERSGLKEIIVTMQFYSPFSSFLNCRRSPKFPFRKCLFLLQLTLMLMAVDGGEVREGLEKVGDRVSGAVNELAEVKSGQLWCPIPAAGTKCPSSSPFHYYRCCGPLNNECCLSLQTAALCILQVFIQSHFGVFFIY
uniref:EGF-like domain-containing protein n=1 Tax=Globodera rostochiensis TaxID=31243 RepID=A0A914I5N1_GLORO